MKIEILLEKINSLIFKYETLKKNNEFNIFSILLNESDEVYLHSQFIHYLLNPKSNHHDKNVYLNYFMEILGVNNLSKNIKVYKEYVTPNNGRIDLLLLDDENIVIIENKIYANDQDKQLQRYFEYASNNHKNKKMYLYYLTLKGDEPSEESLGSLDKSYVNTISYTREINDWLEKCIAFNALSAEKRETIFQYQKLINKLGGKSLTMEQFDTIYKLLSDNKNILDAYSIVESWSNIRVKTEYLFWTELEDYLVSSKKYIVNKYNKYSKQIINDFIYKSRNRPTSFGLAIEVPVMKKYTLLIHIEHENNDNLYYGLLPVVNDDSIELSKEEYEIYSNYTKGILTEGKTWNWIDSKYFDQTINFGNFSNEKTLLLINDDVRSKTIEEICDEISILYNAIVSI